MNLIKMCVALADAGRYLSTSVVEIGSGEMQGFTIQKLGLRIHNKWVTDFLAEILCTFILALFVYASGTQYTVTNGGASSVTARALAGGCGLMIAVYATMKASGGSANPNVSLMFCLLGKMEWKRFPVYVLGEFIGAFLAAALTYFIYEDLIDVYDGGVRSIVGANATAGLFTSFPHAAISKTTGFFDVVTATGLLTGSIAAITDSNNAGPTSGEIPLIFVFMLFGIVSCFGVNTGAAINAALDLSGRLFACIIYGSEVFSHSNYWFWVPLLGGITGTIIASFVYQLMVGNHLPEATSKVKDLNEKFFPSMDFEKEVDLKSYKSSISVISNQTQMTIDS